MFLVDIFQLLEITFFGLWWGEREGGGGGDEKWLARVMDQGQWGLFIK